MRKRNLIMVLMAISLVLIMVFFLVGCTVTKTGKGATISASAEPTKAPSEEPTQAPSEEPTQAPSEEPTTPCIPDCQDRECGSDGCGGSCGECLEEYSICVNRGEDSRCVKYCIPNCIGRDCGSDNCGGSCGGCPTELVCKGGQCVEESDPRCIPACPADCGRYGCCGPDGCPDGGQCGVCPEFATCDEIAKRCVCTSSCVGKECGWDGCIGSCGGCPSGQRCQEGRCVEYT